MAQLVLILAWAAAHVVSIMPSETAQLPEQVCVTLGPQTPGGSMSGCVSGDFSGDKVNTHHQSIALIKGTPRNPQPRTWKNSRCSKGCDKLSLVPGIVIITSEDTEPGRKSFATTFQV